MNGGILLFPKINLGNAPEASIDPNLENNFSAAEIREICNRIEQVAINETIKALAKHNPNAEAEFSEAGFTRMVARTASFFLGRVARRVITRSYCSRILR
jgi:hypothetical protein